MNTITRRGFVGACAAATAAADPLGLPVGFQVYPVREMIANDFAGTLRRIAAIGYRSVEMCSPAGYAKSGFGPLAGQKASEIRKVIRDAGLVCHSSHYNFKELQESLDERITYAKELGLKQMIVASLGLKETSSMDDWKRAAGELNVFGEKTRRAGIQLGFHNHHREFAEIGGVLIYDALMGVLDPSLVKMQFQVAVISLGFQAAPFFRKYPGRFISLHLADWSPVEKRPVPIGKGAVDWKELFANARSAGVKNYYVEMDMGALEASYPFLHGLKV
jgi:sugar phosphate isomerase/epimerase